MTVAPVFVVVAAFLIGCEADFFSEVESDMLDDAILRSLTGSFTKRRSWDNGFGGSRNILAKTRRWESDLFDDDYSPLLGRKPSPFDSLLRSNGGGFDDDNLLSRMLDAIGDDDDLPMPVPLAVLPPVRAPVETEIDIFSTQIHVESPSNFVGRRNSLGLRPSWPYGRRRFIRPRNDAKQEQCLKEIDSVINRWIGVLEKNKAAEGAKGAEANSGPVGMEVEGGANDDDVDDDDVDDDGDDDDGDDDDDNVSEQLDEEMEIDPIDGTVTRIQPTRRRPSREPSSPPLAPSSPVLDSEPLPVNDGSEPVLVAVGSPQPENVKDVGVLIGALTPVKSDAGVKQQTGTDAAAKATPQ